MPAEPTLAQLGAFQREVSALNQIYDSDSRGETFRGIIVGPQGSGKTSLAETCPAYVHVDSFDPGGTVVLEDGIRAGRILADTRFEVDSLDNPVAYNAFDQSLQRRIASGYFNAINTYFLDSLTTLGVAALNLVINERIKKGKHLSETPQKDDWMPQMTKIKKVIQKVASLPCNVIITAHLQMKEDKVTEQFHNQILVTGNLQQLIPILFGEIYVLITKDAPNNEVKRALLTQPWGEYSKIAKTRLGRRGRFELFEPPDIRALLRKAGKPFEDRMYKTETEQKKED